MTLLLLQKNWLQNINILNTPCIFKRIHFFPFYLPNFPYFTPMSVYSFIRNVDFVLRLLY